MKLAHKTLILGLGLFAVYTCFTFFVRDVNFIYNLLSEFGWYLKIVVILGLFLAAISTYLLFLTEEIQKKWWRWARWYLLVVLVGMYFIAKDNYGGGFVTIIEPTQIVIALGFLLSILTVGFTLFSKHKQS